MYVITEIKDSRKLYVTIDLDTNKIRSNLNIDDKDFKDSLAWNKKRGLKVNQALFSAKYIGGNNDDYDGDKGLCVVANFLIILRQTDSYNHAQSLASDYESMSDEIGGDSEFDIYKLIPIK